MCEWVEGLFLCVNVCIHVSCVCVCVSEYDMCFAYEWEVYSVAR